MANEREDILNAIVDILGNTMTTVKKVDRVIKDINSYSSVDLPRITVIGGDEHRNYEGRRMIATFEVIARILDKKSDLDNDMSSLNNIISEMEKVLEDNPYINGKSVFPVRISRIETDEGWLFPFMEASVFIETYYSRFEPNR